MLAPHRLRLSERIVVQSLHRIAGTALVAVLCAGSFPTLTWAQASAEENKETLYAIGVLVARQLVPLKLSEAELSEVTRGLGDAALGRPLATQPEKIREQINAFTGSRQRAAAAAESAAATKFMEDAAAAEGAVQTELDRRTPADEGGGQEPFGVSLFGGIRRKRRARNSRRGRTFV